MLSAEIKTELLTIIDKLAKLERRRHEIQQQGNKVRDRINVINAKNLVEISFGRDDRNKPLYPSQQVRDAALVVVLEEDAEYLTLRDKLRMQDDKLKKISIKHIRLSNRKTLLMFEAGLDAQPFSRNTSSINLAPPFISQ